MVIRDYRPEDEAAVRRVCFETALYGESMAAVIDDPPLITEALLGYYLRFEPEHLWVAEDGGILAGYLSASADTRRSERIYARRLAPALALRFLSKGHWLRPRLWRLALCSLRHTRNLVRARRVALERYPAHLHLNIERTHRRGGVGAALLDRALMALAAERVPGLHVFVASEGGKKFFARRGFTTLRSFKTCAVHGGAEVESWLMVYPLARVAS